jgi:uncharacterized repeat protein (TIGR04138 family)
VGNERREGLLSMDESDLTSAVCALCAKDERYRPEAYYFVLDALDFTARMLDKAAKQGPERHVTGKELIEGVRVFALQEFGPMALTVLATWGMATTGDIGNIVFNLVDSGKLKKTERDQRSDFDGGYDFHEVFAGPFQRQGGPAADEAQPSAPRGRRGAFGSRDADSR